MANRVVTVVVQPDVISHVNNRFNQKERLAMAIAYLETHESLTIRQLSLIHILMTIVALSLLSMSSPVFVPFD